MTQHDIDFKLALATLYNWQQPTDSTFDTGIADKAIALYQEVLSLDPNNPSANYNLGILYYNKAANTINGLDYDTPLDVAEKKMDECVDLFLKALPYMQKAYDLNWRRKDVLEGLVGIYYGLNDDEKHEKYKQELAALKNSNK
jgi:tetratricopeptide (TPR) repeat protein